MELRTDLLTTYLLNLGGIEPGEERIETRQPQADSQPFHYVKFPRVL